MTDKTETLWVTDAELIRRSGVPEKLMRQRLRFYDSKPQIGFPRKNMMFGGRRYWPAVVEFFANTQTTTVPAMPERAKIVTPPPRRRVNALS